MFDFLTKRFSGAFARITGKDRLTEKNILETLEKIRESLLEADIPYEVVERFTVELKEEVVGKKVVASVSPGELLMKIVYEKLAVFLGSDAVEKFEIPAAAIIMVMGLQGSGKTTTIGKLVHSQKKQAAAAGKQVRILTGSVDFYRPAAVEQLEIVAQKAGASFFRSSSSDPVVAAQELMVEKNRGSYDILILDTAGRMHIDEALLQELEELKSVVKPTHKLLVLDSMTGQESLRVAQVFNDRIGFEAAILSKIDSDARGGAAFAFSYMLSRPVAFVGTGEKIEDLEVFHPERMASRILGMGDVQTLSERIDEKIKAHEQQKLEKNFMSGNFTLSDFAEQLGMMNRLGSLSSILKYIPGMPALNLSSDVMEQGEREMKKFKAIIGSMTPKERAKPVILNKSRKQRIARGAGVAPPDIDTLIARFEQSKQFVKLFKKGGFNNIFK